MGQSLLKPFSERAKSLVEGDIYEHYKGMRYKLLAVGRHSETLEEVVIYQALYGDFGTWVRPLEMFVGTLEINGEEVARFKLVVS